MRTTYLLVFILVSFQSFANLKPGFDVKEVKLAIALCNSYNFTKQFGETKSLTPKEFRLSYESDIQSMDNKFQVYENGEIGVINFRGSTEKFISWVENCYSAMVFAKDTMIIKGDTIPYCFGDSLYASVHAGYALTIVLLSESIIEQVKALNKKGIHQIIITGHSQGGALATMTRAFLEHLPEQRLSSKNIYKTYAFAPPMCGNSEFAEEYNAEFGDQNTSFSIINPKDIVPYLPFNYEEEKLISKKKVFNWITGEEELNIKKLSQDAFIKTFEHPITKYVKNSNALLNKLLKIKLGQITMPDFVPDINYYPAGQKKDLQPFEYPQIEVDTTGYSTRDFSGIVLGEDGKWYKKEPSFFQHKPYNYFVYVLKQWDPESYGKLEEKYLQSDL